MFNWLAACHLFLLMCFGFPLLKNKQECQEGKLTDIHAMITFNQLQQQGECLTVYFVVLENH